MIPAANHLSNNFNEFSKAIIIKAKSYINNMDHANNTFSISIFFLTKIHEKMEKFTHRLQNLLKNVCLICENYGKNDPKKDILDISVYFEKYKISALNYLNYIAKIIFLVYMILFMICFFSLMTSYYLL